MNEAQNITTAQTVSQPAEAPREATEPTTVDGGNLAMMIATTQGRSWLQTGWVDDAYAERLRQIDPASEGVTWKVRRDRTGNAGAYTVQAEIGDEHGQIWQALDIAQTFRGPYPTQWQAAAAFADQRNLSQDGRPYRLLVWIGADADTTREPECQWYPDGGDTGPGFPCFGHCEMFPTIDSRGHYHYKDRVSGEDVIEVNGADVQVGDVLVVLGKKHRVDRIGPYTPGVDTPETRELHDRLGHGTRVAYCGKDEYLLPQHGSSVRILERPTPWQRHESARAATPFVSSWIDAAADAVDRRTT